MNMLVTEVKLVGEKDHVVLPKEELGELLERDRVEAIYKFHLCERTMPRGRPEQIYKISGPFLQEGRPTASAVITTANPDRDKDIVDAGGARLENYVQHPVILPMHVQTFPIGFAEEIHQYKGKIWAKWQWLVDLDDTEAAVYRRLWDAHALNAVSIGFLPLKTEEAETGGWHFLEWELLEISPVVIPANAEALRTEFDGALEKYGEAVFASASPILKSLWRAGETRGRAKQIAVPVIKGAITYERAHPNGTPKADEDAPWDGPAEVAAADVEDLKTMCAWVDSENQDLKTAYKLPHHRAGGGHPVVWNGVRAAMAALFGARGGVDIPADDRRAVYLHLARHYREFDKEPPEFQEVSRGEAALLQEADNIMTEERADNIESKLDPKDSPQNLGEARLAFVAGVISAEQFVHFVEKEVENLQKERDAAREEAEKWKKQALQLAASVVLREVS